MAGLNVRDACRKWGPEYLAVCGLSHYFPVMNANSHVFFVDGSQGDDEAGSLGQTADAPLKSITKALSYCSDWSGITRSNDFIFVLGYYQASTETWPIAITKDHVHIIGIYNSYVGGPSWIQPPSTTAAITVAADGVELANLELGAGATSGGIEVVGNATWGLHIHHCRFGMGLGMTAKNGILLPTGNGEMINGVIEDCQFGTKLTNNAIDILAAGGPNTVKGTIIRRNQFQVISGARGINCVATVDFDDGGIYDNGFELEHDNADGEAVYFASGAKGNVDGNRAWTNDGVVPSNNPFYDAGSTGMSFGRNWRGPGDLATDTFVNTGALQTPTNI